MKQILQNLSTGETRLVDVPVPKNSKTSLLIKATNSLISIGTERMLVEFGKANMLDKARQQPEKVKMVLEKVGIDGIMATVDAVKSKLDQPLALGYCHVGQIIELGQDVSDVILLRRLTTRNHSNKISQLYIYYSQRSNTRHY